MGFDPQPSFFKKELDFLNSYYYTIKDKGITMNEDNIISEMIDVINTYRKIDEVFDESQIKDFVRTHYDIADIYDAETIIEQVSLAFEPQEIFSEEEMRIVLNE